MLGILVVSSLYFFSAALQAVAFSFFIGAGNTLSISIGYTVLVVFNLIKDPIRELPMSIGFAIEFLVSMKRIQKFLLLKEINETVVSRKEGTEGLAVEVKEQSNFLWGIRKNDDEKDKEEEKEHKEVLKKRKQVKKSKKNATEVYEEDGEDAGQREQPLHRVRSFVHPRHPFIDRQPCRGVHAGGQLLGAGATLAPIVSNFTAAQRLLLASAGEARRNGLQGGGAGSATAEFVRTEAVRVLGSLL